ncbi:Ribokinase [Eumeta japonica]|uniref:Ribokinase n=1 Tax=Eumeta variegata TaxID=151549 RepID=A0A4C1VBC2_EUMVA|nr:Ribokinase [Eumeta japonica]
MNKIAHIAVIGSCSVDFCTYSPKLPSPGETVIGVKFTTSYGGKGANQCVAAAKLGGKSHMICRLGDDQWGHQYKKHFQENGVDIQNVHIMSNVATGIAQIAVSEKGENQIVIVPGANNYLSIDDVHNASELITSAEILIGQLETPLKPTLEAFKLNKGIKLLNAAPVRADAVEILPYCTILCVNEPEASTLSGINVGSVDEAADAIKRLLKMGCQMVIITLGENGALYASQNETKLIHVLCDPVNAVDTTGAGDAFVGALATFLVTYKDRPIHQIIGAACEVATISVTKEGTQTSYPTNYRPFGREYNYKIL